MASGRVDTRATRWARQDWGLVIAAVGLSLIGSLLVWSATRADLGSRLLVRHLVNAGIGMTLAVVVARLRSLTLRRLAPAAYLVATAALALVLTPVGVSINGSRSWLHLPAGFSLQPSELTKVALAVCLAMVLVPMAGGAAASGEADRPSVVRGVVALSLVAVPVLLVLAQPDLGSAVVLAAIGVGVVACSGVSGRFVAVLAVAGAAVAATSWRWLLAPYQRDRLTAFADPQADPLGLGYQTRQVRLAIGSGGWWGQGLFAGERTQSGAIPFQETDFVFSVAAEEWGFVGAAGLIVLLAFLLFRMVLIALRAPDDAGRLVAVAVAVWFGAQAVQNIGMNLGLTPVTGLPLPLVSYGGSSMFACWLAIGLVANVHAASERRRDGVTA